MELVCIDFTKMDPSAREEENVLVITDAFSKLTQCVVTPNQKALMVAKVLVDKWFIPYDVPARLHNDKGKTFDKEIIAHLCKIYGIQQSTTTPYNPQGNGICERFNRTLHGLLRTLNQEEKHHWPKHINHLVMSYNATPNQSTSFQPYQLMFGRKARIPCDSWLGFQQYDDEVSKSRCAWVRDHEELIKAANRRALRSIMKHAGNRVEKAGRKDLYIPEGNVVLLRDHPEGRNKIQDGYKSELFKVVKHVTNPDNVYIIVPVKGVKSELLIDMN